MARRQLSRVSLGRNQAGWVAWALSVVLLLTSMSLAWFYHQATTDKDQLRSALSDTQTQYRDADADTLRAQRELQKIQSQLDNTLSNLVQAETKIKTLNQRYNELSRSQNQTSAKLNELQLDNDAMTNQLAELQAENKTQLAQIATLNAELSAAHNDANVAQAQLEHYQGTLSQLQGELKAAASTEELYLAAREQLALQQAENETYSETIERLKTEMAAESAAMDQLEAQLQGQLAKLNQEKEKLVTQLEDGTTAIKLPESILFASGSALLNDDGLKSLDVLAQALKIFPNHMISIQGHTDSKKISQTTKIIYPSNWELSSARASSAVRELLKKGIPSAQLQAVGYADTRPLVTEVDDATRQQNRRIEVILLPNQFKTKVLK